MNKGKRKILTNLLDVEEQTCNVPELEGSLNLKESEDPLDAFMNGVEAKLAEDTVKSFDAVQEERLDLLDDEADDNYGRVDQPVGDGSTQDDQTSEYHTGRRPPGSSGQIAPLAAVDHTTITYPSFQKEFFVVTGELNGGLSKDEVCARRKDIIVTVHGDDTLAPVNCFDQLHLPERLERAIENTGYKIPTPVQAQTIPLALAGRDVLALAETGSGKTLAYVWPALIHCASFERPRGTGPRCLVLAPTRELAAQIYREVQRFSPPMRLSCVAIYGGESKHEMALALRNKQPEIVVATPGRLIDLIKGKATTLSNVTMLIVDEADRMFAMGFGEQVRSLAAGVRPDRQALLFSATMPPRLEGLAREAMSNPVRVVVGARGASSDSVHQDFRWFASGASVEMRWNAAQVLLEERLADGKCLVFVNGKEDADQGATLLDTYFRNRRFLVGVAALHGDMDQSMRQNVLRRFKKGEISVLVATDVAARGLDLPDVHTVLVLEAGRSTDTHVHRVGRTGRLSKDGGGERRQGSAFTFLRRGRDEHFARTLAQSFQRAGRPTPPSLLFGGSASDAGGHQQEKANFVPAHRREPPSQPPGFRPSALKPPAAAPQLPLQTPKAKKSRFS